MEQEGGESSRSFLAAVGTRVAPVYACMCPRILHGGRVPKRGWSAHVLLICVQPRFLTVTGTHSHPCRLIPVVVPRAAASGGDLVRDTVSVRVCGGRAPGYWREEGGTDLAATLFTLESKGATWKHVSRGARSRKRCPAARQKVRGYRTCYRTWLSSVVRCSHTPSTGGALPRAALHSPGPESLLRRRLKSYFIFSECLPTTGPHPLHPMNGGGNPSVPGHECTGREV